MARDGYMKPKPRTERPKNPFMKEEVKLISDELSNASSQNMREAIDTKYGPDRPRRKGGRGMTLTGSVRG